MLGFELISRSVIILLIMRLPKGVHPVAVESWLFCVPCSSPTLSPVSCFFLVYISGVCLLHTLALYRYFCVRKKHGAHPKLSVRTFEAIVLGAS